MKNLFLLFGLIAVLLSCNEKYEQKFVSTDVNHFWEAYDKIISEKDTTLQADYLNEYFINKGSEGLKSLMEVRRYTPKQYLDAIISYPKFWNSIRANTTQTEIHHKEIEKHIADLFLAKHLTNSKFLYLQELEHQYLFKR